MGRGSFPQGTVEPPLLGRLLLQPSWRWSGWHQQSAAGHQLVLLGIIHAELGGLTREADGGVAVGMFWGVSPV